MSKPAVVTCNDCYFCKAGLCAMAGETICPTFRVFAKGTLQPPRQPQLVVRVAPQPTLAGVA